MFYKNILRPLLFRRDPEKIHDVAMNVLKTFQPVSKLVQPYFQVKSTALSQNLWTLTFQNPVGLAAGFDKYARALSSWEHLGFGFTEIGTITGREQSGNPKPRLFRLPEDRALINRFGFNNDGAQKSAFRFAEWRKNTNFTIPIGINIGKSKSVDLDQAMDDYLFSFEKLYSYADYFVVNVSSPNTPNLRQLQDGKFLREILSLLEKSNTHHKPILVKIAPDLTWEQVDEVIQVVTDTKIHGIIATNTTILRDGLSSKNAAETGGLSGMPVKNRSTEIIRHIFENTKGKIKIIGVGGIFTGDDAYEKIKAGASLIQIYTGFIYEGPSACKNINTRILELMKRDGFRNISEAIGKEPNG